MLDPKVGADHEAKCERCGRCCYNKIIYRGRLFYTPFPCKHLDEQTRLCRVYERRHQVNPDCLSVEEGLKLGVFPADCPYAQRVPDYKAPVVNQISSEVARLIAAGKISDL
jgi:hypothetical protein